MYIGSMIVILSTQLIFISVNCVDSYLPKRKHLNREKKSILFFLFSKYILIVIRRLRQTRSCTHRARFLIFTSKKNVQLIELISHHFYMGLLTLSLQVRKKTRHRSSFFFLLSLLIQKSPSSK